MGQKIRRIFTDNLNFNTGERYYGNVLDKIESYKDTVGNIWYSGRNKDGLLIFSLHNPVNLMVVYDYDEE